MRLPSVETLITDARRTLVRFPAVIGVGLVAAVSGAIGVDSADEDFWLRLMGTAALAIPLFLATDLTCERRRWALAVRVALWLAGAGLLAAFMAVWFRWSEPVAAGRYIQLSAAFHLLVAVAPFVGTKELHGFWQYNKTLFLRALTAALFTAVLYAGLAVALLALDNLFGLDVSEESYARLFFILAFVFNTWFFLGGVPADLSTLEHDEDYPRGLKIFAQYVLVPLVAVYLVILTLYLVKVLVTQEWPSGWIGWLVSSVAAAGIFSLLLVHPVAERAENRWMRTYARGFYIAIFPSIVMLWLAIYQRVDQYGITEPRYFLTILSVWLAGIAVYHAITRSRDIRIIPASLCVGALLTFAGPWGAYRVSESSQVNRLEQLLRSNDILENEIIRPASGPVGYTEQREINAIVRYLTGTHGTGAIAHWFNSLLTTADTLGEGTRPSPQREVEERTQLIAGLLGIDYVGRWAPGVVGPFRYFVRWNRQPVDIGGYDVAVRVNGLTEDSVVLDGDLVVRYDSASAAIEFTMRDEVVLSLALSSLLDSAAVAGVAAGGRGVDPGAMRLTAESRELRVGVYVTSINGERGPDGVRVRDLDVQLFYSRAGHRPD
jgi:hypothetical protein